MNPVLHIVADLSSGSSVLIIAGTLFLIPFIHEDIAIIAAALLVAQHRLSIEFAFLSVCLGMVGRDLLLYGLGALARYNALARRYLIRPRVQQLRSWLGGKMIWVILVSRLVPGLMFPAYIAIGWFNLPFLRYLLCTTLLSLLYLPVVFGIVYLLGSAALSHLGNWTWLIAAVPITVLLLLQIRAYIRRSRIPTGGETSDDREHQRHHAGNA
jgi:membrane protein DedA with SNARE-associated domain